MVLVDIREPDALAYAAEIIAQTRPSDASPAVVVVSARPAPAASLEQFSRQIANQVGMAVPVLDVDVREPAQMFDALELPVAVLPD